MTQRKTRIMTKTTLLAATFALALGAGSASAENTQLALGSVRPAHPVSIASGPAANVPAVLGSSAAPLGALLQDWDRAGFAAPTKPAQARIYGRNGYVTSGGEYHAMVSLLQAAIRDSHEGRDEEALGKITQVRALFGQ